MNKLYLDMDGVLCDFNKFCIERISKKLSEFDNVSEGWQKLEEFKDILFSDLAPLSNSNKLVNFCVDFAKNNNYELGILTALPRKSTIPNARQQKYEWLEKRYPFLLKNFVAVESGKYKMRYCTYKYDILIDDMKRNIDDWENAGGIGLLYDNSTITTTCFILNRYKK